MRRGSRTHRQVRGMVAGLAAAAAVVAVSAPDASATFPGRDGTLLLTQDHPVYGGQFTHLAALGADGAVVRWHASNVANAPAWSPDGTKVAFAEYQYALTVLNADATPSGLTVTPPPLSTPDRVYVGDPVWSPAGDALHFPASGGVVAQVYAGTFDGRPAEPLRPPGLRSPDGRRSLVVAPETGEATLMRADGTGARPLGVRGSDFDWSPDSTRLVYARDGDVHLLRVDRASRERRLTRTGRDREPVWAPSGRSIAFLSARDGHDEVYEMRAGGGRQRKLSRRAPLAPPADPYPALHAPDWQALPPLR